MSYFHDILKSRQKAKVKVTWKEKGTIEPVDSSDSAGESESPTSVVSKPFRDQVLKPTYLLRSATAVKPEC